jgi:hypothetical protein
MYRLQHLISRGLRWNKTVSCLCCSAAPTAADDIAVDLEAVHRSDGDTAGHTRR